MSDEQLWRWFAQFRDGPGGPMRMPSAHEIRRRARIWWATRLGGALAVAVLVVCAVPPMARQLGSDRTPTVLGPTSTPSSTPFPMPTPVTSPASDTFQIQPINVRPGQNVTLSGQGCTTTDVRPTHRQVAIDVKSPDGNARVAWLRYPARTDGSWQGQWRVPTLPSGIKYGSGFQLQPFCEITSRLRGNSYLQQVIFAYDLQRLTIQPPA